MKIGSIFSGGLGGLELGLEAVGVGRTVWQCEIDPAARANLARHWPGVTQYHDVRTLDGRRAEPVDLLCGGFPCVGTSSAGKGLGLEDPRSGLWFEYARLIGELRPRFVVVENTPLLPTRGLEDVLRALAELGYDAVWFNLRARDVGAPHKRQRIFIVAWLADADSRGRREGGQSSYGRQVGEGGDHPYVSPTPSDPSASPEGLADAEQHRPQGLVTSRATPKATPKATMRGGGAELGNTDGEGRGRSGREGGQTLEGRAEPSGGHGDVVDARSVASERRRGARDVAGEAGPAEGEGLQREWSGDAASHPGEAASERRGSESCRGGEEESSRRRVAHADGDGSQGVWVRVPDDGKRAAFGEDTDGRGSAAREVAHAVQLGACRWRLKNHIWPPGPNDADGWREFLKHHPRSAPAVVPAAPAKGKTTTRPQLNPVFVERLMGVPEDWTQGKRKDRLIHLGNGVVPQVAMAVGEVVLAIKRHLDGATRRWTSGVPLVMVNSEEEA